MLIPAMFSATLEAPEPGGIPTKQHLLLVDDEPAIRALATLELRGAGYRVTTASDADQALRLAEELTLSLVILDIMMPKTDGLSLLETLKQRHPTLPVVILTGIGVTDEVMKVAMRMGADAYVSKGMTISYLVMEIRRVLRKK